MPIQNVDDFICQELRKLHHAEQELTKTFRELKESGAASSREVRSAFRSRLRQLKAELWRVESVVTALD